MGKVVLVVFVAALATACDDSDEAPLCDDDTTEVSVSEPLAVLDGESAEARFQRIAEKPWDCSVTWLELPASVGTSEPGASSSALELVLERTSETARYQKYGLTWAEKYDTSECHADAVFVPSLLGLKSEDGALDEALDGELRLQGDNTLIHLVLESHEFGGTHAVTFADGIEKGPLEFNFVYVPGTDPTRIDGSIVESGNRTAPGSDPLLTTAVVSCAL